MKYAPTASMIANSGTTIGIHLTGGLLCGKKTPFAGKSFTNVLLALRMVVAELVLDFPSVASHDATDLIPGIRHNAASFQTTKRILFVIIRRVTSS